MSKLLLDFSVSLVGDSPLKCPSLPYLGWQLMREMMDVSDNNELRHKRPKGVEVIRDNPYKKAFLSHW